VGGGGREYNKFLKSLYHQGEGLKGIQAFGGGSGKIRKLKTRIMKKLCGGRAKAGRLSLSVTHPFHQKAFRSPVKGTGGNIIQRLDRKKVISSQLQASRRKRN